MPTYVAPNGGNITLVVGSGYSAPSGGGITLIFPSLVPGAASISSVSGCMADSASLVCSESKVQAVSAFSPEVGLRILSKIVGQIFGRVKARSASIGAFSLDIQASLGASVYGGVVQGAVANIDTASVLSAALGAVESASAAITAASAADWQGGSVVGGKLTVDAALTVAGEGSYSVAPDEPEPNDEITSIIRTESIYVRG